jgi:hypothetical protein
VPVTTSLEIIDTAVKVGLGAFITGCVGYAINERNKSHEVGKTKWEARKDIILELTNSSQEYFSSASKFLAAVDGASKDIAKHNHPADSYKEYLNEKDDILTGSINNLEKCYALLLILVGDNSDSSKVLWDFHDEVSSFRKLVFREKSYINIPSQEKLSEVRNTHSNLRKDFYCSLRKYIDVKNA